MGDLLVGGEGGFVGGMGGGRGRGGVAYLAGGGDGGLDDAEASGRGQQVSVDQVDVGGGDGLQDALYHHGPQQPACQVCSMRTSEYIALVGRMARPMKLVERMGGGGSLVKYEVWGVLK